MPPNTPQNPRQWIADALARQAAARQSLGRTAPPRVPAGRQVGAPEEGGSIGDLAGNVEDLQQTIAGNRRIGLMALKKDLEQRGYKSAPEPWMMQGAGGGRTVTALKFDDPDQTTFSAFPLFGDDSVGEPNVVFKGAGKARRWSFGDGEWRDAGKDWPIVR